MSIKHRLFKLARVMLIGCTLIVISGMSGCPPIPTPNPSSPHNKDYRFVIPKAQQGVAATIDGTTAPGGVSDPLWNNAATFDLDLGTSIPAARMWAVADETSVYLYFDIEADDFNQRDVLVLLLGPNPAGGGYRRLHIKPCGPNGILGDCPTTAVIGHDVNVGYWTGTYASNTWAWSNAVLPSGFEAKSSFQITSGSTKDKWSVELKLPIGAFALPATGFFGLYVDLADVTSSTGNAWQYPWPPIKPDGSANIIGGSAGSIVSQIQSGTPSPDKWGLATLSDSFGNGVYITSSDIRTNHSNSPIEISLTGQNRFYANAHNNLSQAGQLTDANGVRATFKIANWGVGNPWINVPTGGPSVAGSINVNPTSREPIVATGSRQYEIGPWALTQTEQDAYRINYHQCIKVDLDTNDPNTLFFQSSAQQNMDFVETQSPFKRMASVGIGEVRLPERSSKQEIVLRERTYNTDQKLPWKSEIGLGRMGNDYVVRVKPDIENKSSAVPFNIAVEPPSVELARTTLALPADGDKAMGVNVKPGELITILARGSMLLRKDKGSVTEVGPSGRDFTGLNELFDAVYRGAVTRDKKRSTGNKVYPLRAQQAPETRVGALVGSWDGFRESSFVIGQAVTLKVPGSARALSLAVNDLKDTGILRGGEGFAIDVISTPLHPYHGFGNPMVWRDDRAIGSSLPVGANLPIWIMRGAVNTGKVIVIDGETFNALEPIGSFGAVITKIGR